jgi:hemerythrin-like domain-containing protein
MKPIGPLMREHRLIEKMLQIVESEVIKIRNNHVVDPVFIDEVVDFIRTYADRTHHGKEEDILFRELVKKDISPEHTRIMDELIAEHTYARKVVGRLVDAKDNYIRSGNRDLVNDMVSLLAELAAFYPKHIEKEDKHFFYPCLQYFNHVEQQDMLSEFWDFDRRMIHEKYGKVVENFEKKT